MRTARLLPLWTKTRTGSVTIRWMLLLAVLSATADTPCLHADQKSADSTQQPPLLRLLRESRGPYQTVAVRFVQNKRLTILDVILKSEGMIFFRRPGLIRYEIVSPVKSLLLHDGQKTRCYAFTEGRWELLRSPGVNAVGRILKQIGHWIQGDFDADQKMFHLNVLPWDKGAGRIQLTPRSKTLAEYIRQIDIYVDKAPSFQVSRVVLHESDVDTTEMLFGQERRNKPIPEKTFVSPDLSQACLDFFVQTENEDPNELEKPQS